MNAFVCVSICVDGELNFILLITRPLCGREDLKVCTRKSINTFVCVSICVDGEHNFILLNTRPLVW